jgi:hypothetical protein
MEQTKGSPAAFSNHFRPNETAFRLSIKCLPDEWQLVVSGQAVVGRV